MEDDHTASLKELGYRIRRMRADDGFSQETFADFAGVDRTDMGGIERGEHDVAFSVLCQIATALECELGQLTRSLPLAHSSRYPR